MSGPTEYQKIVDFIRDLYEQPEGTIPLHAPVFQGREKEYLAECVDSTFVSSVGRFVEVFEKQMTEYTGARKAVACVNGSRAASRPLRPHRVSMRASVRSFLWNQRIMASPRLSEVRRHSLAGGADFNV